MLSSIRKFSSTIYAKILMCIIIVPFVLWGMGGVFGGGNKNTIATINKEKISTQDFINYFNKLNIQDVNLSLNPNLFEEALSTLIGEKIIQMESNNIGIDISEESLAKIIKNEKVFMNNNKFSRTKYEKFLLTSNINVLDFEDGFKRQEKKRLLINYVVGGIKSPKFLVNNIYNEENQIREIEILNLNHIYEKEKNFSEEQIKDYFESNQDKFKQEYRAIKYALIKPKNLIGKEEFNNLFFQKLDKIEDLIVNLVPIEEISKKFNLEIKASDLFDEGGSNIDKQKIKLKSKLLKEIFKMKEVDNIALFNYDDNYIVVQLREIKHILTKIEHSKDKILSALLKKHISDNNYELLKKISKKIFNKTDFVNLASDKNIEIKKIKINGINDDKNLNKNIVYKIYKINRNNFGLITSDNSGNSYIVHVHNIYNKEIIGAKDEFNEYFVKSNTRLTNAIYKTYDSYIGKKYKVNINYQTLDTVKNYYK